MSKYMQFALVASHEALEDAGWKPSSDYEKEMTVSFSFFSHQITFSFSQS